MAREREKMTPEEQAQQVKTIIAEQKSKNESRKTALEGAGILETDPDYDTAFKLMQQMEEGLLRRSAEEEQIVGKHKTFKRIAEGLVGDPAKLAEFQKYDPGIKSAKDAEEKIARIATILSLQKNAEEITPEFIEKAMRLYPDKDLDRSGLRATLHRDWLEKGKTIEDFSNATQWEVIVVQTQYGPQEYFWEKDDDAKLMRLWRMMGEIEENYATQNPIFQIWMNEIFNVMSEFRVRKGKKGEVMYQDFLRRYHLLGAYEKFALGNSVDDVLGGYGTTYTYMFNVLIRDSSVAYEDAGFKEGTNMQVWHAINWYKKHAKRILDVPENRFSDVEKEAAKHLTDTFGTNEQAAKASALLGRRLWEIQLTRAKQDDLVGPGRRGYDLYAYKRKSDGSIDYDEETGIPKPDKKKRYEEWQAFMKHAMESKLDYRSQARLGNHVARNMSMKWDFRWGGSERGFRARLDLLEGMDFNYRDNISMLPKEIYDFFNEKGFEPIFRSIIDANPEPNIRQALRDKLKTDLKRKATDELQDRKEGENKTNLPDIMENEFRTMALELTKAITGTHWRQLNGNFGYSNKAEGDEEGFSVLDTSKMILNINDLNSLVKQGIITKDEREDRLEIFRKYFRVKQEADGTYKLLPKPELTSPLQPKLDRADNPVIGEDGEVVMETEAEALERELEDLDEELKAPVMDVNVREEKTVNRDYKRYFLEIYKVFDAKDGHVMNFDWTDNPSAKTTRYAKSSDDLRSEFTKGPHSFGRHPTYEKFIEFAGKFDFLRGEQFGRITQLMNNFGRYLASGGSGRKPAAVEGVLARLGGELNINVDEMQEVYKKMEAHYPFLSLFSVIFQLNKELWSLSRYFSWVS